MPDTDKEAVFKFLDENPEARAEFKRTVVASTKVTATKGKTKWHTLARDIAKKSWAENPKEKIITLATYLQPILKAEGDDRKINTIYDYIKNFAPPHVRKGGRSRK